MASKTAPTSSQEIIGKFRFPHPYLTTYYIAVSEKSISREPLLQVVKANQDNGLAGKNQTLDPGLHNPQLYFSKPELPAAGLSASISDNTFKARAQRSPRCEFIWDDDSFATQDQLWLVIYGIFTIQPELEFFRAYLKGPRSGSINKSLRDSMLAISSPLAHEKTSDENTEELVISRCAFWQGAGSPFSTHSPWTPTPPEHPSLATDIVLTTKFPDERVHALHPRRPAKPAPGSVVYSRYIASLDEHFSLIALDTNNEEHVQLFHKWQNDPRVAKGWNETGNLEEHRNYLKRQHEDPHTLPVFGRFDDVCFAYFEIFYAKEDHVGAHYNAGDYDRGRHSLVGDSRYRGRHRVLAWWPCVIHYVFLDDPRTQAVIGEPIATNSTVLGYDYMFGLHVDKFVDFPHKRAALVKCSRERFFQLCPLYQAGGLIAGTGVQLPAKI